MARRFARAASLVCLLLVTGCAGTQNSAAPLSGSGPASSARPGTPEAVAKDSALATVKRFYATWAQLESNPAEPVDAFAALASGQMLTQAQGVVLTHRSQQLRGAGAIRIVDSATRFPAAGVPLDSQGNPVAGTAWIQVRLCTDMAEWHLRRRDGALADDPRPRQRVAALFTVVNVVWPQPHGWRITGQSEAGYPPCDGER